MKIRTFMTVAIFLLMTLPLLSEDSDKNEILKAMTFPIPDVKMGAALNDPFFPINIQNININTAEIKKIILSMEKELNDNTDPEKFIQLGNYYKNINDNESAVKYYNKYLESTPSADITSPDNSKTILAKGEVYYSLSEIDLNAKRIDNLEKSLLFFTRAVELNQDNAEIFIKLGDCYLSSGKTTEASNCYNKALEKNPGDFHIYIRLQAASFQKVYLKLLEAGVADIQKNQILTQGFDFEYLETAINNSPEEYKELLKLQHYVYLLRLILFNNQHYLANNKNEQFETNTVIIKDDERILNEAEKFLKSVHSENINTSKLKYLSGIMNYLKADYKKAICDFKEILDTDKNLETICDDIIFINSNFIKDSSESKKNIEDIIKINPDPGYYLLLAGIEFENNNLLKAEMLSQQSLKINRNYAEAYSANSVIYAANGNYIAADEMIKKGNLFAEQNKSVKQLNIQMKVNEAAIALLKNEKERAYILLRSIISVDNNEKAQLLYNRYFIKK